MATDELKLQQWRPEQVHLVQRGREQRESANRNARLENSRGICLPTSVCPTGPQPTTGTSLMEGPTRGLSFLPPSSPFLRAGTCAVKATVLYT